LTSDTTAAVNLEVDRQVDLEPPPRINLALNPRDDSFRGLQSDTERQ